MSQRLTNCTGNVNTVMILSFRTDMAGQTMQTQIRGSTLFAIPSASFGLITLR